MITRFDRQSEDKRYTFDPIELKHWLEKQDASNRKKAGQNDYTAENSQKGE
jgi:hypothetical protein